MKAKYIYICLSASLLLIAGGCKKFLEQPVLGQYQGDNFFTNDANAKLGVNAAYSPLTFTDASSNTIWVLGSSDSGKNLYGEWHKMLENIGVDQKNILSVHLP